MVDLILGNHLRVIWPMETRLAINRLGIDRSGTTEEKDLVERSKKGAPSTIKTAVN